MCNLSILTTDMTEMKMCWIICMKQRLFYVRKKDSTHFSI